MFEMWNEKVCNWWNAFTERKKNVIYFLFYMLIFCMALVLVFYPFLEEGKNFVWTSDGLGQYIVNLYALYSNGIDVFKEFLAGNGFSIPMFSFSVGLGSDITGNYFVSILEYLGFFLKRNNIEVVYNSIIIMKIFFAGISFSWLCRYWKCSYITTLIGTYVYVFSGFTLYYGVRHPQFLMPLILFPCLLIASDRVLKKKSPILFVLLIFYSMWMDYYFLYMNTILLGIYLLVQFFYTYKENRAYQFVRMAIRIVGFYLMGIGMAALPLIIKVLDFLNSPRTSGGVDPKSLLWYGKGWIIDFVSRVFAPYTKPDYVTHYMLYAVLSICFFSLIILFFQKEQKYMPLKIWSILLTLFFVIPIFGYVFSGFSATINRWAYAYVLLLAFVTVVVMPNMLRLSKVQVLVGTIAVILYSAACILAKEKLDFSWMIGMLTMIISWIVILLANLIYKKQGKIFAYGMILIAVVLNIALNGESIYSIDKGKFASEFVDKNTVLEKFNASLDYSASMIGDPSFYRTELFRNDQHTAGFSKVWNYNGTSIYDSTNDKNLVEYFEEVENLGILTVNNIYNYDGRVFLEALASVKYFVTVDGAKAYIPYGYTFEKYVEKESATDSIYRNSNYLPIGYTYSSYIEESELKNLNSLEKQEAMLQSVVLDKGFSDVEEKATDKLTYTSDKQAFEMKAKDVIINDHSFEVTEEQGEVEFVFDGASNAETYLRIEGLDIDEVSDSSMAVNIHSDDMEKSIWVPTSDDLYKLENNNYLINLGYCKDEKTFCKIVFPKTGKYRFQKIEVLTQSMENLSTYVTRLSRESLENVKIGDNFVKGNLNVEDNKILCFSIPYSKGWRAQVDGKEVELQKANGGYMAIPVLAGNHKVELKYTTPGLISGGIIMGISFLCFLVLLIVMKCKGKEERLK